MHCVDETTTCSLTYTKNTKSDIVDYLEEQLIQTRPYFAGNIMLQPAYSHLMDPARAKVDFPNATHTMLNTYFHGTSPVITPEQIAYIGRVVDGFMGLYI
jgi:CDP-4-dehydro-6-deoxyglucose reductase, E1